MLNPMASYIIKIEYNGTFRICIIIYHKNYKQNNIKHINIILNLIKIGNLPYNNNKPLERPVYSHEQLYMADSIVKSKKNKNKKNKKTILRCCVVTNMVTTTATTTLCLKRIFIYFEFFVRFHYDQLKLICIFFIL